MIGQLAEGAPSTLRPPSGDWISSWRSPAFTGDMAHQLDPAAPSGLLSDLISTGQPSLYGAESALDVRPYSSFPGAQTGEAASPAETPAPAGPIGRVLQAVRNALTRTRGPAASGPGGAASAILGAPGSAGSGTGGASAPLGAAAAASALVGTNGAAGAGGAAAALLGARGASTSGAAALLGVPGTPASGAAALLGAPDATSSSAGGAGSALLGPAGSALGLARPPTSSGSAGSAVSDLARGSEPTFAEVLAGGRAVTAGSAPSLGAAPALASSLSTVIGSASAPDSAAALLGTSGAAGSGTALSGGAAPSASSPGGADVGAGVAALLGTPSSAGSTPSARLAAPGLSQVTAALPADARRALTVPTLQNLLPTFTPITSTGSGAGSGSADVAQALEAIAPGTTAAGLPVASQSAGPAAPAGAPAGLSRRRAGLGAPLTGPLPSQALPVASAPALPGIPSAADLAAAGATEVAIPGSSASSASSTSAGSMGSVGAAASAVPGAALPLTLARSVANGNQMLPVPPVVTGAFQDVAGAAGATVPLLGERALSSDVTEMLSPAAGNDTAAPAQPITYLPPHSVDTAGPSGAAGFEGPPAPGVARTAASPGGSMARAAAAQGSMTTAGTPAGDAGRPLAVARPPAAGSAAAGGLVEGNVVQSVSANNSAASVAIPPAAPETPAASPATAASTAPAAGTPAGNGGALSAADVDGLARRLYEPIARRLKAELVVDRDRTGTLMDRMW